ncbi:immunity 49 family protein [Nocardia sp. 2]|uniref:Immunity 49 family protein n=1 Tax=Nocardia acididurans TaxID=2802282 RepID=A0ABS1MBY3_9NOCA|nr:immunity 49 family protein [Nocardia acididurans]MBL1078089.1 immunity 49 family protein [Nocardia acididurans]
MRIDRHHVPEQTPSAAIEFVRTRYTEQARAAEAGGLSGVRWLAEVLLDYVGARTVEIDPAVEQRETWFALRSAVILQRDFVRGQAAGKHTDCYANAQYASHYFRFTKMDGPALTAAEWTAAWWPAVSVRFENVVEQLAQLCPADHAEGQALVALWSGRPVRAETLDGDTGAAVRAIASRDADGFDTALAAVLRRHREQSETRIRELPHTRYRVLGTDLIAWEAVGLAALAHRAGMPLGVESAYLPSRLVTGAGPLLPVADGRPITRPPFDADRAAQWLERFEASGEQQRSIEHAVALQESDRYRFNGIFRIASESCTAQAYRSVLDPRAEDPRTWSAFVLAAEAAAQAFRLVSFAPGTMVPITLAGRTGDVPALELAKSYAGTGNYLSAVALAWTARSESALEILAAVPDVRHSHDDDPDYQYALAVRALLRGEDPARFLKAATRPATGAHIDYAVYLDNPRVRLLERFVDDDHEGFDTALAEAVALYRDYHSVDKLIDGEDAQMNVDLLGLACLAADRGFPITVESDYLPRRLIDGAWLAR